MDIATGALGALLPKLAQLLRDEYNLQKGVRKDIEFLTSELETMHAALRKVGQVPREQPEELQRIWARDVRDLSYNMEDMVDTFMVRVQGAAPPSKRSAKRFIKKIINIVTKARTRREVAQEIKDIKERVREVAARRDRYRVDDTILIVNNIAPAKKIPVDHRIMGFYTQSTELVGIDEAKEEVITMLTKEDDEQHGRIVSIAGFGGLGKTTLAKAVYDEIKGRFGCTAFVSVSRNPDTKKLLKDILYELHKGGQHPGANLDDIKQLIDLVREFLKNQRYLIVIDDIWDIEPWKIIRCALDIENNLGSRIITTTRIIGVAEQVGGCYRLKPLSDESSEILFYGRIFGSVDKCPWNFYEISKKILKKCGGVPLAIVTTSSLLANNNSEHIKAWHDVCDSIGSGLGRNPGMDDMTKILMLSYYDLPSHLKTCLLYLSVFPEDYEIEKDRLIWMWVAEGFVQHRQGHHSFHETGESYFNELLNRSLILPARMDVDDTPQACRVHDTVLDLIISLTIEESFVTTTTLLDDEVKSIHVRRLSMYNSTAWPTMKMPKLRSLTIFEAVEIDPMLPSLSRYHLLRVLDLRGCRIGLASLRFVGSLCHLRYLALPSTVICRGELPVPAEIGKLQFLQTLDVSETEVAELPSSITGLKQLMCLRARDRYFAYPEWTRMPDGLKKLTSLQVLESALVVSKSIAEELGHLMQLRVLKVQVRLYKSNCYESVNDYESDYWRACAGALVKSLGKLEKIESLYVDCPANLIDPEGSLQSLDKLTRLRFESTTVPTWIGPAWLPALSYLDTRVRYERREDIQVLGTLPCLRQLRFWASYGCQPKERRGVVPSMFPRGAMPKLQDFCLMIKLEDLCSGGEFTVDDDLALDHLPSLRSVSVRLTALFEEYNASPVVGRVREKLKHEAAVHPNHPRTQVVRSL